MSSVSSSVPPNLLMIRMSFKSTLVAVFASMILKTESTAKGASVSENCTAFYSNKSDGTECRGYFSKIEDAKFCATKFIFEMLQDSLNDRQEKKRKTL